ncbi:hypothetical protein [Pseudomonas sp. Pseusp3]|uniref:hypothetical protein n=1 Tax=unclassified Pseudomonas TaxID=196821 RepID=UPI0039AEFC0C
MCHILEGTVRLTDADGVAKTFGPGGFVRGGGGVQGNPGKHHAGAQGVFHSRMRSALASRDDASCEQSGLRLAWERRQPVRQRKFQGRLQGV